MSIKESLISALGNIKVSDDPDVLEQYSGKRNFGVHIPPVAVVQIENAEQAQALIKWANETKTPITPVSSKDVHVRGSSSPSVAGSVIADLSGMKKIISVNRQHRMAVVEAGVTYGELSEALAKEGMSVSMPLKARAGKSVVTSLLDIEPRMNPAHQWSFNDPLRCVEVVWGDGNHMFTGEAAGGPLDLEKQQNAEKWQVSGAGPWMFDFYRVLTGSQGTMGIVTWAALKCQVIASVRKVFFATADTQGELEEFVASVLLYRFADELFIMNNTQAAMLLGKDAAEVKKLKSELPKWIALVGVCGRDMLPEKRVEVRSKDIGKMAKEHGVKFAEELAGMNGVSVLDKIQAADEKHSWKDKMGSSRDIFFLTTIGKIPEFVECAEKIAAETGFAKDDVCVYVQPMHMGTSWHCEFTLPFDSSCPVQTENALRFYEKASKEMAKLDAYYSRPYGLWSELQLSKDAQSYEVLKKLRSIFDPSGIMNPGKITL